MILLFTIGLAGTPAAADPVSWIAFDGKTLAASEADDPRELCPSGPFGILNANGTSTIGLGASLRFEWSSVRASEKSEGFEDCLEESSTSGSRDKVHRRRSTTRCRDKSLRGTDDITLSIIDPRTVSYRWIRRDERGKVTNDLNCKLTIQKD